MKKSILLLGALLTLSNYNQAQTIRGEIQSFKTPMVYLYQVKDEYYGSATLQDSIRVVNGQFTYKYKSAISDLYYLSLQKRDREKEQGEYLFLSPIDMKITIDKDKKGKVALQATGSTIQDQYQAFRKEKDIRGNRQVCDSLNELFYAAREKDDRTEMARIKEASGPYYDESRTKTQAYVNECIKKEAGTLFGLYLYFANRFQHNTFGTAKEIADVRNHIATFNDEAKASTFYTRIEEGLKRFEACATGSPAPAIAGTDMKGNPISLSQFKGKYVLVDFWSSGCGWCRKETVHLQKAYDLFKDKNFTILGVSSDFRQKDWLNAIEEDKSYWNHLLIPKDDIKKVLDQYCIIGIPHIILVDPQGIIIAKELRGEEIAKTIGECFPHGEASPSDGNKIN